MTKKTEEEVPPATEAAPDPFQGLVPGRIVFYWPAEHTAKQSAPGPWPAMVTALGDRPGVVTLNVNKPAVTPMGEDPVERKVNVPHASDPTPECWTWPRA